MKKIIMLTYVILLLAACGKKETAFDATGTFEATEVTVSAKATGELKNFNVVEGQTMKANEKVGDIDVYQLLQKQDELNAARMQLDATAAMASSRRLDMQKQLASITQQIENALSEQKRFTALVNDGAVPRKQLDDINNQIKVLRSQLNATRDQIRSNNSSMADQVRAVKAQVVGVEAQKRQLADQIKNADIVSPITGIVLEKYAEQGEFVAVGRPLIKVANTEQMYIRAYVTSIQLKDIKIGQKVRVKADFGRNERREYDGVITWISNRSEFTPKTILTADERADLVYAVKVRFRNDGFVKIGMYGEVKL